MKEKSIVPGEFWKVGKENKLREFVVERAAELTQDDLRTLFDSGEFWRFGLKDLVDSEVLLVADEYIAKHVERYSVAPHDMLLLMWGKESGGKRWGRKTLTALRNVKEEQDRVRQNRSPQEMAIYAGLFLEFYEDLNRKDLFKIMNWSRYGHELLFLRAGAHPKATPKFLWSFYNSTKHGTVDGWTLRKLLNFEKFRSDKNLRENLMDSGELEVYIEMVPFMSDEEVRQAFEKLQNTAAAYTWETFLRVLPTNYHEVIKSQLTKPLQFGSRKFRMEIQAAAFRQEEGDFVLRRYKDMQELLRRAPFLKKVIGDTSERWQAAEPAVLREIETRKMEEEREEDSPKKKKSRSM